MPEGARPSTAEGVDGTEQPADGQASAPAPDARTLFERGVLLSEQERWGEAAEYFRRSSALEARPSTSFNLAVALLHLGRHSHALRALQDYLRDSEEAQEPERRAEARRLLELSVSALARVRLTLEPAEARVFVNGEATGGAGATRELSLDPGRHALRVEAQGYRHRELEISLIDGERRELGVSLQAVPQAGHASGPQQTAPDLLLQKPGTGASQDGSWFEEPLFWIAAGAVLVGAGLGLGLALTAGEEDPYAGSSGVILQGLSIP